MKRKLLPLLLIILLILPMMLYAHSGGTDSSGGHYDHATGEYHYHHGERAHQHYNGVCEIEVEQERERQAKQEARNRADTILKVLIIILGIGVAVLVILWAVFYILECKEHNMPLITFSKFKFTQPFTLVRCITLMAGLVVCALVLGMAFSENRGDVGGAITVFIFMGVIPLWPSMFLVNMVVHDIINKSMDGVEDDSSFIKWSTICLAIISIVIVSIAMS